MSLLSKNSLPAEIQRGCLFSELFESSAKVALNRGTITGTLTFPNPNQALFSGTQKIVYPTILGIKTVSFWITLTSTTESIIKLTSSHSISVSSGTLAATGFSSPTIRVNGVATTTITTARSFVEIDTATAIDCNDIQVGYIAAFGNFKMEALKFWTSQLTLQEALDYFQNSTFNYRNKAVLDLPMDLASYDFTNKKVLDRSGKGNDATLGDGSTASTFPTKLSTKGFSFDGGDYLDLGDKDAYSFTDGAGNDVPFSISLWIKPNTSNNFLVKFYGANTEYAFSTASDLPILRLYTNGSNYIARYWNKTLVSFIGQWIHLVCTYDGSKVYAGLRIYSNGIRVDDSNDGNGTYTGMSNTTEHLYLGYARNIPAYFNGSFGSLTIFRNITLTPLQILDLYLEGKRQLNMV